MVKVEIYSKGYCPFCQQAKATLSNLGVNFKEFEITNDANLAQEMYTRSERLTVPQIFIDNHHVGGNDDLQRALQNGTLNELLQLKSTIV